MAINERSVFLKALEFRSVNDRAAFLDQACANDPEARRRIEALLKAHAKQDGIVDALVDVNQPTSGMAPETKGKTPDGEEETIDLGFLGPGTSPDSIGSIGSFDVLEVIGRGGMGLVLKARDIKLQRIVAIKVLAPEIATNKTAKKRFEREALAAAAVSHDHIVTIYAVDEFNNLPYLVMECIVGRSLQQKIEETGPLELKEILRIGMQAAQGLAAAHKQGLVHRDIKPANILLQNGIQRVKITDFGLARLTDDVGMTQTGQIAGTPLYMSPEQAQGQKVDHTSDLFSLGSVLYTMATGRPAFRAPSTIAVLRRVVDHTPRPVNEINEELPSWLGDIISKLMSKKKEDRFQTAAELAELFSRRLARLQEPRSSTSTKSAAAVPAKPKIEPGRKSAVSSKVTSSSRVAAAPRDEDELPELPERSRRVKPVRKETMWDRMRNASPLTWLVAGILVPGMIALVVMMAMLLNRDQLLVRIELDESLRQQDVTLVIDGTAYAARDLGPSIRVKPGPHTLEVKRGNEQFKSEQFTIFQNETPLFRVKTEGGKLSVERADPGKEVQILAGVLSSSPMRTSWHGWPADAPAPAIAPFTAAQAKKHQQEWATYLKVPVEWRNSINMKFILIPPGEFTMGSTPEEIDAAVKAVDSNDKYWQECIKSESPQHKVILTQPIFLGENEVTQAEYEKVMGVNPSHFAPTGTVKDAVAGLETANHPVEHVSWDDAAEFCAKLSQREKLTPFYFRAGKTVTPLEGTGYRLPSEAEWEFACRAGTTTKYWIGDKDEDLLKTDWIAANSGGRTHSTGELRANPFGLTDIHGNLCEWVDDGWDGAYYSEFKEMPAINPRNPFSNASFRVVRGGAWVITSSLLCRSSHRYGFSPSHPTLTFGFRASLPVDAVKNAISQNSKTDTPEYKRFVEWVKLRGGSVSPEFPPNGQLPEMVTMYMDHTKKFLDDADLERFNDLPGVNNTLGFRFQPITTAGMIRLGKIMENKTVGQIALYDMHVGLDWLREPGRFAACYGATFQNIEATDEQLINLKNLPQLTYLNLCYNKKVTDASVEILQQQKELNFLLLDFSGVTDAGLAKLRAALPNCKITPEKSTATATTGPTSTPEYKRFVEWIKSRGGSVSPEFPADGSLPHMVGLNEDPAVFKPIIDGDLEHFLDLPGVQNGIGFRFQNLTTQGMIRLGKIMKDKPVGQIFLVDMPVGLDWLREPGGLSVIHGATLQNVDAKSNQLAPLKNFSNLDYLNLRFNKDITDEAIVHLEGLKKLRHLALDGTGITDAGMAQLRAALPDCEIVPKPNDK